jgi:DNA polymerase-4
LAQPTDSPEEIAQTALALLDTHRPAQQPVRLIGVGVSGLLPPMRQMTLFDIPDEREERLSQALHTLRQRFGDEAVRKASDL